MQFYLNFHNHIILVSCNEEIILKKLQDEFHYFIEPQSEKVTTVIKLFREIPPELPSMVAVKVLETCCVYRLGTRQFIDYRGQALTIWDHHEDSVRIYSLQAERLYEIAFLAIHSILGQNLDLKGICRVHALAISLNQMNAVVMLPSKGGKSTLLQNLLENEDIKIISDDMPLIDLNGYVHAFASKISLELKPEQGALSKLHWTEFIRTQYPPKWTAGLSQLSTRIDSQSYSNNTLLVAGFRLSSGESIMTAVAKWKMLMPLIEHMIIGVGLPQILEMFVKFKFTDVFKLALHGFMRSICALQLLRKSKCYYLYMGSDRTYNARLISDLLYDQKNS